MGMEENPGTVYSLEKAREAQETADALNDLHEHIETVIRDIVVSGGTGDVDRLMRLLNLPDRLPYRDQAETRDFFSKIFRLTYKELKAENGNENKVKVIQEFRAKYLGANLEKEEMEDSIRHAA